MNYTKIQQTKCVSPLQGIPCVQTAPFQMGVDYRPTCMKDLWVENPSVWRRYMYAYVTYLNMCVCKYTIYMYISIYRNIYTCNVFYELHHFDKIMYIYV